jgi:hypothetical protein
MAVHWHTGERDTEGWATAMVSEGIDFSFMDDDDEPRPPRGIGAPLYRQDTLRPCAECRVWYVDGLEYEDPETGERFPGGEPITKLVVSIHRDGKSVAVAWFNAGRIPDLSRRPDAAPSRMKGNPEARPEAEDGAPF